MIRLRLVFMGTPSFAVPALRALHGAGHDIIAVYCQPPRPAGRGKKPRPSAVQQAAEGLALPVRYPATLKDAEEQAAFAALGADAAIVAAYGLILPHAILTAPRLGCLNIHASLLPRWRGAAPIQRAILAGDRETGITIMQMDEGLDTGDMLAQESVRITGTTTAADLSDTLAAMGARLITETLPRLAAGGIAPTPQPDAGAVYAPKLSRAEGRLDWTADAEVSARQVRALTPWPGAWFENAGERIKVLNAQAEADGTGAAPGTLLDDRFTIACGSGALRLDRVQRPGKAPMEGAAALRGMRLQAGNSLD